MIINVYAKSRPTGVGSGLVFPIRAVMEGFKRHNVEFNLLAPYDTKPCDLAVTWGIRHKNQVKSGKRCLVMERGYMLERVDKWVACGFDGLNGRANFCNKNSPPDRWNKYFSNLLKPWKRNYDGEYVLVMGQLKHDTSIANVDIVKWYVDTIKHLTSRGCKVVFRPHPDMNGRVEFRSLNICTVFQGDYYRQIRNSKWVVTYNSNSAVDSVLYGIPAISMDKGSMAWDVTGHDLEESPPMLDREKWCYDLSYAQWSIDEICQGIMWDHLKKEVDNLK